MCLCVYVCACNHVEKIICLVERLTFSLTRGVYGDILECLVKGYSGDIIQDE